MCPGSEEARRESREESEDWTGSGKLRPYLNRQYKQYNVQYDHREPVTPDNLFKTDNTLIPQDTACANENDLITSQGDFDPFSEGVNYSSNPWGDVGCLPALDFSNNETSKTIQSKVSTKSK